MSERRCIVAMGGGGFSTEPDNPLLDQFVVELAEVVTARPDARAFRVVCEARGLVETALPARFLGSAGSTSRR